MTVQDTLKNGAPAAQANIILDLIEYIAEGKAVSSVVSDLCKVFYLPPAGLDLDCSRALCTCLLAYFCSGSLLKIWTCFCFDGPDVKQWVYRDATPRGAPRAPVVNLSGVGSSASQLSCGALMA